MYSIVSRTRPARLAALTLPVLLAACAAERAPLFEGMGAHSLPISAAAPLAQRYFDQGLVLCYGFNRDEALRSFTEVTRIAPEHPMGYWGQALALGPDINVPMSEEAGKKAWESIQAAIARLEAGNELERDLVRAMAQRFAADVPAERAHLDRAYAEAMGALARKHAERDDVLTLYAESLLDLSPWDQWRKDGTPKENTLDIVRTLETVLARNPQHPGANHLYIHTVEASKSPERALPAARRLETLVPGIGHLVHMGSHIYVRLGMYNESYDLNLRATEVDRAFFARVGPQAVYHGYHVHNDHFAVYSAMFAGRYEDALRACDDTLRDLPEAFHGEEWAAEWLPMHLHVHLRFGRWEQVLEAPMPRDDQPYAVAMWRYARGVANANLKRIEAAEAEAAAFEEVCRRVPETMLVFIVPAHEVLAVARDMMRGETLYHEGKYEEAFAALRAAVRAEDALRYSEPSPWMMPVRHALGALLLEQGQVEEAEAVYRADLERHPNNGWALHGLAECLGKRGAKDEAEKVRARFEQAWSQASVPLQASCFCRKG